MTRDVAQTASARTEKLKRREVTILTENIPISGIEQRAVFVEITRPPQSESAPREKRVNSPVAARRDNPNQSPPMIVAPEREVPDECEGLCAAYLERIAPAHIVDRLRLRMVRSRRSVH